MKISACCAERRCGETGSAVVLEGKRVHFPESAIFQATENNLSQFTYMYMFIANLHTGGLSTAINECDLDKFYSGKGNKLFLISTNLYHTITHVAGRNILCTFAVSMLSFLSKKHLGNDNSWMTILGTVECQIKSGNILVCVNTIRFQHEETKHDFRVTGLGPFF